MLRSKLNSIFKHGQLTVILPNGKAEVFGEPQSATRPVVVRLKGTATPFKIAMDPDRFVGEAFMDGTLVMEKGTIFDLLMLAGSNIEARPERYPGPLKRVAFRGLALVQQYNNQKRSQRNVAHHYDLSAELYRLFLDRDMQYSCAYFAHADMSLEEAQVAKKNHIIAKLAIRPGQRVLDIGCGWGGLGISIAQSQPGVQVLGITLSKEQLAVARQRAEALGLQDRVRFELQDYRTLQASFDRIVSVGMFEHVGTPNYATYFAAVKRLLKTDGVALIHSIGRRMGMSKPNAWIDKYIFPGGYIPALSEVMPAVEASGLWTTDIEILRLHYAETLRHWRERFMARKAALAHLYDERFNRMWEFYLASSEMSFRHGGLMVFQAQLTRAIDALPITRDYMFDDERAVPALRAAE